MAEHDGTVDTSTDPPTSEAAMARQAKRQHKRVQVKPTDTSGRPELTKVAQQRAVGRNARTRSVHKED